MSKFDEMSLDGICEVCGKHTKVVVCASSVGAMSCAYCKDCLSKGLEPYGNMVAYISLTDKETINDFTERNEKVLKDYYKKTKEDFKNDCMKSIKSLDTDF